MSSYLFIGDYNKQIQEENLNQIIGNKESVLESIQLAAVAECVSYLKQKYDTTKEFKPTTQHDKTLIYLAGQTVYLNAPSYSATSTYAVGVQVLQAGNIYQCSTAITVAEVFNLAHWTLLGPQYTIYYSITPNPVFNYKTVYAVDDIIFWKDKVYTCKIATSILSHDALLQIGQAVDTPIVNIFPDDPKNGLQYWGIGVAYSVPATTAITNTTYWTLGDARDQKLLMICIDIALYHAHSRISARNIPESRIIRYMGNPEDREVRGQRVLYPTYCALGWLQAAAIGHDITPELPMLQPAQGKRIRYGGNVKLVNSY